MKIALIGYGKMGKTIDSLADERGHEIVARINSNDDDQWQVLKNADVAIEFTSPNAAPQSIKKCVDQQVPVVTGSTGWYDQLEEIERFTHDQNGALLHASNFSIGVNIFMEINRKLAELMDQQPQYEPEISETHHTEKLDAPSGTAVTLATDLIQKLQRKTHWVNEQASDEKALSIKSRREPEVPGTHEILYRSEIDEIQLVHIAKNRKGFALGALIAAEWLVGKSGVFTMKDVLKLNHP